MFTLSMQRLAGALLLGIFIIAAYLIEYKLPPLTRGFSCEDRSIRHPLQKSTVGETLLLTLTSLFPIVLITTSELCIIINSRKKKYHGKSNQSLVIYQIIWHYLMIFAAVVIVFGCSKAVGKVRPNFLDTCRPQSIFNDSSLCTERKDQNDEFVANYISHDKYVCTSKASARIRDSRRAFFSGHASLSFYASTSIILYFENWRNLIFHSNPLQAPLQITTYVVEIVLAIFISASRVADHKHFWEDVIAGMVFGTLAGFFWWSKTKQSIATLEASNEEVVFDSGIELTKHSLSELKTTCQRVTCDPTIDLSDNDESDFLFQKNFFD